MEGISLTPSRRTDPDRRVIVVMKRVALGVPPLEEFYWTGEGWSGQGSKAKRYDTLSRATGDARRLKRQSGNQSSSSCAVHIHAGEVPIRALGPGAC
jgi:hypothetical protein